LAAGARSGLAVRGERFARRIASAVVASGEKGTVLVGIADVEAAIDRLSSGSVGGAEGRKPSSLAVTLDGDPDGAAETGFAGR
jgi:hypothetical protein